MNQKHDPQEKLDRLIAALIEETFASSDDDILAAVTEGGEENEPALRAEIDAAVAAHRRQRLTTAKAAIASHKRVPRLVIRSTGDLRTSIARAIVSNDGSFTLAAREGRDVSVADLEGLAEDLRDLGFEIDGEDGSDAS